VSEEATDSLHLNELPTQGPLLAVDWGTKRFGIALSDPNQKLAHPIGILTRRPNRRFPLSQLRPIIDEHRPVGILVGLPLDPDGGEGDSAKAARATADIIRKKTSLPVAMHDERMTSARVLTSMDGVPKKRRRDVDDLAATLILQSYLDTRGS
jgi:putative Holliday junction resolvase